MIKIAKNGKYYSSLIYKVFTDQILYAKTNKFGANDLQSWQMQESYMFDHQYSSWCNAWKGSMFEMKSIAKHTTYISVCYHTQTWNLEQKPYRPLLSSLEKSAWRFSNCLVCSMTKNSCRRTTWWWENNDRVNYSFMVYATEWHHYLLQSCFTAKSQFVS